jgi:hypothetical protein
MINANVHTGVGSNYKLKKHTDPDISVVFSNEDDDKFLFGVSVCDIPGEGEQIEPHIVIQMDGHDWEGTIEELRRLLI